MQLQIQHGRIGKPSEKTAQPNAVSRAPDADVGAGIDMGRVHRIDDDGIVLHVEQRVRIADRRAARWCHSAPLKCHTCR